MGSHPVHIHRISRAGPGTRSAGLLGNGSANPHDAVVATKPPMMFHVTIGKIKVAALAMIGGRHVGPSAARASPGVATVVHGVRVYIADHPGVGHGEAMTAQVLPFTIAITRNAAVRI